MTMGVRSAKGTNLRAVSVSPDKDSGSDDTSFLPVQPSPLPAGPVSPNDSLSVDDTSFLPVQPNKTQGVYDQVSQVDPNHTAKVLALSNKMGASPDLVDKNLPQAEKAAQTPAPSFFSELEAKYPGTTKWLSDPKNMAVAHDDLPNVAQHEDLIQKANRLLVNPFEYGLEGSSAGLAYRQALPDAKLAPTDPNVLQRFAMGAGGLAGDFPAMLLGGAAGTLAAGPFGAAAAGFALPAALKSALEQKIQSGHITSYSDILKEAAKQGFVGLATAGAGSLAKMAFPATALGATTLAGTVAPLAAEVGTMTVAGKGVEGESPTLSDLIDSALQVGAMHGVSHMVEGAVQGNKAQAAKDFYTAIGDTAEASKLRDRMPEAYKDLVHQLTVDGPVENIYVPADAAQSYFQSKGIDPAAAMEELGVSKSFEEAKSTGGDIQIPLSTWTDKIVGTEHYQGLADDVKFSPDDMTARQVNDRKAEIQEQVQKLINDRKEAEAAQAAEGQKQAKLEEVSKVYQKIQEQLKAAGLSNPESQFNPQLHEAFFNTLGQHLGVDPAELAERFPLQIGKSEDPVVMPETTDERMAAQHQDSQTFDQGAAQRPIQSEHPLPDTVNVTRLEPTKVGAEPFAPDADKSDKKAYRDAAWKFARDNFQGKEFTNEHTGWDVSIFRDGLDRSKSHAVTPEMAAAFGHLDELLKSAVFLHEAPDLQGREEVKGFKYLYAPAEADGKSFVVKIAVKEAEGRQYHVHDIEEVEKPAGLIGTEGQASRPTVYGSPEISIGQLQSDINQVREHNPMFQGAPKLVETAPRGRIRIGREGYAIDLFKNADRSTFLHETGHYFLDVMGHIANDDNAPQQIKNDYKTLLDWMGVNSREEIGTDEHEKFARGFEQYLMEGKAPSSALTRAFNRFRKWLTSVYESTKNLNVEMSDDVRGVMDRMLASQDEIEKAQQAVGMREESLQGIPPELEARIKDLQGQARDQAETALLKEQMKETTAKHKEFLTSERQRQTEAAEKEVSEIPLYKAMDEASLDIGRDKRSGEGDDAPTRGARAGTIAEKFLAGKLEAEDAGKFEALAEVHGFGSGEELAQHMILAEEGKLRQREIDMRVEAGMAPHADLMNSDAIKAEALKSIHNDKMTELLALERDAMSRLVHNASVNQEVSRRQRIVAKVEAMAAKEQAREILSAKPIKDATDAKKYVTAERNAAVKVAKALAKKDFEKAAEFKRQQMLNHAIASEAMRNQTVAEKSISYLSDFATRKNDLKDMPYGFTRQIDQLLSKSGFADPKNEDTRTLTAIAKDMAEKGEDPAEIANRTGFKQDATGNWVPETLSDFVTRVNDNYYAIALPDSVMNGAARAYGDLTLGELKELRASVKTIADVGKKFDRYLGEYKTQDIKQAASEFRKSVEENFGTPHADDLQPGSRHAYKFQELLAPITKLPGALDRMLDTILTTCHKLDGLEEGPAKDNIYRPLENAESRQTARIAETMKDMDGIFAKHYDMDEFAKYKDTRINVDGRYFTKDQILAMALNWGNEGNRQRLMDGFGFDEAKMDSIFKNIGKKDWEFCQDTWDHLQKYWPEIVKLEMEVNGVEPKGVESAPFENQHGKFEGGYYPIAYDSDKSAEAYKNNQERDALYKQFSTAAAHTEQGHTNARAAQVNRPLSLDLSVLRGHHEDVIHDLEFRRAVIDVNRFLNQKDTKAALTNALGVKGYAAIGDWLKSAAGGGGEPLTAFDKAAQWFRFKTTFYNLGYRLVSAPKIAVENMVNISSELGMSGAARAMKDYYFGDSGTHEMVIQKSDFMRLRGEHLDRDLGDIQKKWQGTDAGPFKKFAFFVHAYLDQGVSFPLWADVYNRAIADHGEEKLAVNQADEAVKRTFMSGGSIDQPEIMRGGEKMKALTTAYGYQSMMWNRFSMQRFEAGQEWAQGNHTAAVAVAARAFIYTFALPAVTAALTREMLRNNQTSSDDDRKKRVAETLIEESTPLKFVPILRDVSPYLIKKAMGDRASFTATPLEEAATTLIDPLAETLHAFGGKGVSDKFPEKTLNAVSLLTGVPKEINDMAFNFMDWQQNKGELTWRDALSRKTKR